MTIIAEPVAEDRHRPAVGRPGPRRKEHGDVHVLRALHRRHLGPRRGGRDAAVAGEEGLAGEAAEGDRAHVRGRHEEQRELGRLLEAGGRIGRDLPAQLDAVQLHARVGRMRPARAEDEAQRGRVRGVDRRAHLLEPGGHALGREDRDGGDLSARHAEGLEPLEHEPLSGHALGGLGQLRSGRRRRQRLAGIVLDLGGQHQGIAAVLEQRA
jgi:hypothetical protein